MFSTRVSVMKIDERVTITYRYIFDKANEYRMIAAVVSVCEAAFDACKRIYQHRNTLNSGPKIDILKLVFGGSGKAFRQMLLRFA